MAISILENKRQNPSFVAELRVPCLHKKRQPLLCSLPFLGDVSLAVGRVALYFSKNTIGVLFSTRPCLQAATLLYVTILSQPEQLLELCRWNI